MEKQPLHTDVRPECRLLMRATGIAKAFGGQPVLTGVDLELHEGQVVLLQGPNGSGKTTLLNILTGHLVPDAGRIDLFTNGCREVFHFPRHWWQDLNPLDRFLPERLASKGVGRSWQDTRLFNSLKLLDNIAVAKQQHPGEKPFNLFFHPGRVLAMERQLQAVCGERLVQLGLGGRDSSSGDKVSLGQAKRVAIARAVEAGARILFLDEPLAGLDAPGIADVVALLRDLVDQHRVTLVIIEHVGSIVHVQQLADTVWDLDGGKLTTRPNHCIETMTKHSLASQWRIDRLFHEFKLVRSEVLPRGARLDVYRKNGAANSELILEVENLVIRRNRRPVIGWGRTGDGAMLGLNLTLRSGDLAVLQAPNGWGKTTLMDCLAGLLPANTGKIKMRGQAVTSLLPWERSLIGLYYLRSDTRGFPSLSVRNARRVNGRRESIRMRCSEDRHKYGELSGGQKRSFQINCLGNSRAALYILDEPFVGLDGMEMSSALNKIVKLTEFNGQCLLVAIPHISIEHEPC